MKVKNITKEEKTFKPVTLEITIESEDELNELYDRLNINFSKLKESVLSGSYQILIPIEPGKSIPAQPGRP